jgi:hypothetical protein
LLSPTTSKAPSEAVRLLDEKRKTFIASLLDLHLGKGKGRQAGRLGGKAQKRRYNTAWFRGTVALPASFIRHYRPHIEIKGVFFG